MGSLPPEEGRPVWLDDQRWAGALGGTGRGRGDGCRWRTRGGGWRLGTGEWRLTVRREEVDVDGGVRRG